MAIPNDLIDQHKGLGEWSILVGYRGSVAHGMYVPNTDPNSIDDKDVMAICVPPIEYYFGLKEFGSRGTQEINRDEWDIVVYEARKFIGLLAQGNPNVLTMLWLDPKYYTKIEPTGQILIDNRKLFAGRHVYRAFVGYAHGQLHRMTHTQFHGRMGAKRKQLVEKFGYDTKNAAHLIRLLKMGVEFLTEGELYVERVHDAATLLEIKRGEWSLEKVISESDYWFKRAEEAYIHSKLPDNVDMEKINNLAVSIIYETMYVYAKKV